MSPINLLKYFLFFFWLGNGSLYAIKFFCLPHSNFNCLAVCEFANKTRKDMDPREKPYRRSNPFTALTRHFISETSHSSKPDSQVGQTGTRTQSSWPPTQSSFYQIVLLGIHVKYKTSMHCVKLQSFDGNEEMVSQLRGCPCFPR